MCGSRPELGSEQEDIRRGEAAVGGVGGGGGGGLDRTIGEMDFNEQTAESGTPGGAQRWDVLDGAPL